MKTAYSYLRWSTATQGDAGRDSKTRQTNSATEWMSQYGKGEYVLSDVVFKDEGKSGYKGKHLEVDEYGRAKGDLMKFIQAVDNGTIKRDSILLVDDYSRFSRLSPFKSLKLFTDVIDSGIGLVFTGSYEKRVINIQLIEKEGNVLQFIIGELIRSFSESNERGRKITRAHETKVANIKNGLIRRSHLPSHFTFVPNVGEKFIGKYIHNERIKIIKDIVEFYIEGKSLYSIADILNERGLKTFRGNEWNDNSISKMLKDRTLIGEYKGMSNYVPKVIDETVFNKVQSLLIHNAGNRGKRGNFVNMFRGICVCASCGKSMEIANRYKDYKRGIVFETPYRYLRCSNHGSKNKCENRNLMPLGGVVGMEESFFLEFLFKTPTQLINGDNNKELTDLQNSITVKEIKLSNLTKGITNVIKLSQGQEDMTELKVELNTLNVEREKVKTEIENLKLQISTVQESPTAFNDLREIFKPDSLVGHDSIDWVKHGKMFAAIEDMIDSLRDNKIREQIRAVLPTLISKITVDSNKRKYSVFNRVGKLIYES